jgi:D-3-phosphoglycerate dehydrogenase
VALGTSKSKFSAAVDKTGRIYVEGAVKSGTPYLTKIGSFDVELSVQGSVLLCRQRDQPGIVGNVGMVLGKGNVNINFMTVCRTARNEEAIMAIGIDDEPTDEVSKRG